MQYKNPSVQYGDIYNTLVVLDIDDFKHVNDRLGHHCGDEFMILMRNVIDYKILDYKYNQLQNGIKKLGELIGYTDDSNS